MSKARDLADLMSTGGILEDGALSTSEIVNVTAAPEELNLLDGATVTTDEINKLDGVTATTAELNKLAGTTATTSDFDKLSNVTASATELNYMTGATSSIQSQLDNISVTSGSLTKTFASGESATITLAQSITPAPVVQVTKEVAQVGQSSKGAWDVNATASNYDLHNTAYATTLTPSSTGYGFSSAVDDSNQLSYGGTDNYMQKLYISPDGLNVILSGNSARTLYYWKLSTAWDLSTASYYSSLDVSGVLGTNDISMLSFKSDGTRMYVGTYGNDDINTWTLSTAWEINTATWNGEWFNIGNDVATGQGFAFKSDGTEFYVCDLSAGDITQYSMSTAWDISSANSTPTAIYSPSFPNGATLRFVLFNSDGTKMYILNDNSNYETVAEYSLSTAWAVHTASPTGNNFDYSSNVGSNVPAFWLKPDGTKIFFMNNTTSPSKLMRFSISSDALVLGTGSFASTDVGKRIQGNGGDVILTSTAGAYDTTGGSAFTDSSTIASGSWTMHGLKSAGASSGLTIANFADIYDVANAQYDNSKSGEIFGTGYGGGLFFNSTGTEVFTAGSGTVYRATLSTAWDISTQSTSQTYNAGGFTNDIMGFTMKDDGTRYWIADNSNSRIIQFDLGTPFNLAGSSYSGAFDLGGGRPRQITFSPDGTKLFVGSYDDYLYEISVQTPFNIGTGSTASIVNSFNPFTTNIRINGIDFNGNGTEMFIGSGQNDAIVKIPLSTPYSLSGYNDNSLVWSNQTILLDNQTGSPGWTFLSTIKFADDGKKLYIMNDGDNGNRTVHYYQVGTGVSVPTSQYHLAVTNASGQIDSAYWTDINSMTADQSLGDGEAYYAVSTDDRTTWSVAKGSDGVRPIVRDNAGTWQYNTAVGINGYDLSVGSYDSVSLSISANETDLTDGVMGDSGTKLYVIGSVNDTVYQYNLSTANDLSTATYANKSFSVASQTNDGRDIQFKTDGTKMYILDRAGFGTIYQYSLSTAWDVSTASYDSVAVSFGSDSVTDCFTFKPDGTKGFVCGTVFASNVYQREMTTPWDLSTLQTGQNFNIDTQVSDPTSIEFNNDGTKMFIFDQTSRAIYEYDLSTAYDITTTSYNNVSLSTTEDTTPKGGMISSDGSKIYMVGNQNDTVYQYTISTASYTTSTTWANATTNDEFYALQQALGATSVNRMDKTQLDAVADGSHFTLGDTLDLMIALKQDTASASLPTSDGVTINYDAEALNQGAVLGTDYDFDFPANNKVRITSNAAQNLKIRVV